MTKDQRLALIFEAALKWRDGGMFDSDFKFMLEAAMNGAAADATKKVTVAVLNGDVDLVRRGQLPVDRTARELASGAPLPDDDSHTALKPNGQQQDYVVLSADERAKGFIRPVRHTYEHKTCGHTTTMSRAIAETYARDPSFYSGTFCHQCGAHYPIGEDGEFVWQDGSMVGT